MYRMLTTYTHRPVTPSDETVYASPFSALHIGGAGKVTVVSPRGEVASFVGLSAGQRLDVVGTKVLATDTTATDIVAIFAE